MMYEIDQKRNFTLIPTPRDGDCGYSAIGFPRTQSLVILRRAFTGDSVDRLLLETIRPAVREAIYVNQQFWQYLIKQKVIESHVSYEQFLSHSENYSDDLQLVSQYIEYDVRERRIKGGWAHPAVLRTIAAAENVELVFWKKHLGDYLPYRTSGSAGYDFYTPLGLENPKETRHILASPGHFDKLVTNFESLPAQTMAAEQKSLYEAAHQLLNSSETSDVLVNAVYDELSKRDSTSEFHQIEFDQALAAEWSRLGAGDDTYHEALSRVLASKTHCFSCASLHKFGIFAANQRVNGQPRLAQPSRCADPVETPTFTAISSC